MAEIGDFTTATITSATATAAMPVHESGDLIVFLIGSDGGTGGAWPTPSGYDEKENLQANSLSSATFTKVATSSSEIAPSSTQSVSDELKVAIVIVKDIDTGDAVNGTVSVGISGVSHQAAAITPDEDNCLLLFWQFNDNGARFPSEPPGLMGLVVPLPNTQCAASIDWTFQQTGSVAAIRPTWELTQTDTGHIHTIVINSANSSPIIPPVCDFGSPPSTIINPLRSNATTSVFGGGTVDPSADLTSGLGPDSETFNYEALSTTTSGGVSSIAPAMLTDTPGAGSANELWGGIWNLSAGDVDLTGKVVCMHVSMAAPANFPAVDTAANGGFILGLRSDDLNVGSSNAYRVWNVAAIDSQPSYNLQHAIVFDVDDTALQWGADVGSEGTPAFDSSVVTGIFLAGNKGSSTDMRITYAECQYLNTCTIVGGGVLAPAKLTTFVDSIKASRIVTINNQGGASDSQVSSMQSLQVGNGTESVHFVQDSGSLEFATTASEADRKLQYNAGGASFTLYGVSGDKIHFTNSAVLGGTTGDFIIHPNATSACDWNLSGLSLINRNAILRDVFSAAANISFINCPTFTANDADLSGGCIFDNTEPTVTSEAELTDLSNGTFKNADDHAITITGNQTGTWTNKVLTFSNNTTNDIEYTGATNFTIQNTTSITVTNSGAGTLTISLPTFALTLNSDTASTLIRYFEDDSQTIVDSVTGTTLVYTFPDVDPIDIEFLKQGYVPVNRQNVIPFVGDFDVIMDLDEAYNSGHGLTITSEFDYVRATKVLTINSDQAALDVRSALADVIRTNASYNNTALLMVAIPGLTRIDLVDGATITSMATWKGAGSEVFDSADALNPIEKWFSIKSGGAITGGTVQFRQTDSGNSTNLALTNNVVDEAFQYFDDPNHDGSTADGFDFSGYMLIKSFLAGSKQARVDVLVSTGLSALASNFYSVVLANESHPYSGSDPGINADITIIAGGTFGGKVFAYEIVDGGTNTGADIADQLNYDAATTPNAIIPGGTGLRYFELPDAVIHTATAVETERGFEEGTTPTQVGFYCSRSSADHPDFTRFQADDGTYFTPAVTANVTFTNMPVAGGSIRLQIHNESAKSASAWSTLTPSVSTVALGDKILRSAGIGTEFTGGLYHVCTIAGTIGASEPAFSATVGGTVVDGTVTWTTYAILFHDADPASTGFSDTYIELEEFSAGDTFRYRFAELNGTTSFKIDEGTGLTTSDGFSVVVNAINDAVYTTNAVDGSSATVTDKFSPDLVNNEIDLDTNMDFALTEAFAFYCFSLTTSAGMYLVWGAVDAIDSATYLNDASIFPIFFDETAGFVKQTDTGRWSRTDDERPARDPTSGGAGIEIHWRNPVKVATAFSDPTTEPTSVPSSTASLTDKISMMFAAHVNKTFQTDTDKTIRNTSDTADIGKAAVSNDGPGPGATVTREKYL